MEFLEHQAESAEESGDLATACRLWKELAETQQDVVYFCRYAEAAEGLGAWSEAEDAYASALKLSPNFAAAMEGTGALWLSRTDTDRKESAGRALEWLLKAQRHELTPRGLTLLGVAYLELDKDDHAQAAFAEAIQLDPEYEEALYNLALIRKETDPNSAISLLQEAVRIDPAYAAAHQELGKLYQQIGNLGSAEIHLRRSLESGPTDYWTHLFLANLLAVKGENAEAESLYRFATTLHPEIQPGIEFFARFLESIGRSSDAAAIRQRSEPQ